MVPSNSTGPITKGQTMKFTLEIELGDAMKTYADVLEAIRKGFDSVILQQDAPNDTLIEEDATGLLGDANGTMVGKWEVTDDDTLIVRRKASPVLFDALSPQSAKTQDLGNTPMPWCEACGGYHHATAPGCFAGTERDKTRKQTTESLISEAVTRIEMKERRIATLDLTEEARWKKIFSHQKAIGHPDDIADENTFRQMQVDFPRLQAFDGISDATHI